tara:strand:- start:5182 stop:5430 length:249 start_codon:yes stop_codon:yes gene_type:complete
MVDSIGAGGQTPKVISTDTIQKASEKRSEKSNSAPKTDEVTLSDEALSLSNAQQAAQDASTQISENRSLTLSSDVERLNALV